MGPVDQRSNEIQNQILVYTTEKLPQDIGIAGLVEAELYVSSTAIDTDFVIKLIDVHEDGTALNILEGIQRMRNWLSEDGSEKMHPDEIYQVRIGLGNTCYVFKKAHQIRVEITSSDFPQWDRNTNSGKNHATDTFLDLVVALQTIHHDRSAPSHIVLPCCKEII
jgi:hypothetical protein